MSEDNGSPSPGDLSLLGMARRAGRVAIGLDASVRALRRGRARLVVLATDLSPGTAGKVLRETGDVPVIRPGRKDAMGRAIGRLEAGVLAITDDGFSKALASRFGVQTEVNEAVSADKHARL